jgi:hypothetical protein
MYLLASSLAAALLDGIFAHPAWLLSIVSTSMFITATGGRMIFSAVFETFVHGAIHIDGNIQFRSLTEELASDHV